MDQPKGTSKNAEGRSFPRHTGETRPHSPQRTHALPPPPVLHPIFWADRWGRSIGGLSGYRSQGKKTAAQRGLKIPRLTGSIVASLGGIMLGGSIAPGLAAAPVGLALARPVSAPQVSAPQVAAIQVSAPPPLQQPLILAQSSPHAIDPTLLRLWDQGHRDYQAGHYRAARDRWYQALATLPAPQYPGEAPSLPRLQTLNYLAVVYQELGQYRNADAATNRVIASLIDRPTPSPTETLLLAQALNRRGYGELEQGQAAQALGTWQTAEAAYGRVTNAAGQWGSRLNQARALQALGYYRQAKTQLLALAEEVQGGLNQGQFPQDDRPREADSLNQDDRSSLAQVSPGAALQGELLRSLATALESLGELDAAETLLQQSLTHQSNTAAAGSKTGSEQALTLLSLGNLARAQGEADRALGYYRQAQAPAPDSRQTQPFSPLLQLQIQLNELRLLTQQKRFQSALATLETIDRQWATLDPSRSKIYARLNFAASLFALWEEGQSIPPDLPQPFRLQSVPLTPTTFSPSDLAAPLVAALTEARSLGDTRAQAHALTQLSQLYARLGQWSDVARLAPDGLTLAQTLNAPDLIAPLAWDLGRAHTALGQRSIALAHYATAFTALQRLRSDLLTVNPEVQLTFRDTVEPLYRDYVSLLLAEATPNPQDLHQARTVMEALQVAELDNYFRGACLDSQPVALDNLDPRAAIVYPIVLADRLEVIISRPNQPLLHHRAPVSAATVTATTQQLYDLLLRWTQRDLHYPLVQTLYNWLLRSAIAELQTSQTETLVFVPDTPLRRLPMAVLHDGDGYVIEDYNVVLSPGLQALPPSSQRSQLSALGVGITIAREGFEALPGVDREVDYLAGVLDSQILMNQAFTRRAFTQQLNRSPFGVVHVATHGQFSSNPDETFLLAWDDRITLADFDAILAPRKLGAIEPIELLVLSACQTAAGDDRAPLGLAGFALKSGARSTLASLWSVSDEATAQLMTHFYRNISAANPLSFSEALRQAQLDQIHSDDYSHPAFWAAFVLVGNWR
ncbi:MAG: CHAT domain-containing protein [Prochlorothrix sp.]